MTTLNSLLLARTVPSQVDVITPVSSNTYTLPSAGIKVGYSLTIYNNSDFQNLVNASGGLELTTANGCNQMASHARGQLEVIALQDTPTLPAHWFVKYVHEYGTYQSAFNFSSGGTGTSGNLLFKYTRTNNQVTVLVPNFASTTAGTPTFASASFGYSRLTPASAHAVNVNILDNNVQTARGLLSASPAGAIRIWHNESQTTAWGATPNNGISAPAADGFTITYMLI